MDSVPFSSMIAGMLLCKERISAIDAVNMVDRLSCLGIMVDDENDDIDCLSCCAFMNEDCSIILSRKYDDFLSDDVTVSDYLEELAGIDFLNILSNDLIFKSLYEKYCSAFHSNIELDRNLNKKLTLRNKINNAIMTIF